MGTLSIGNAFCTCPGPNWHQLRWPRTDVLSYSNEFNSIQPECALSLQTYQHVLERTTMSQHIKLVTGRGT